MTLILSFPLKTVLFCTVPIYADAFLLIPDKAILCMVYNATGKPITALREKTWHGYLYSPFPQTIQNGQWGTWLWVADWGEVTGTSGCMLYRASNRDGMFILSSIFNFKVYSNITWLQIQYRLCNVDRVYLSILWPRATFSQVMYVFKGKVCVD